MITIRITNATQVVRRRKGWLVASLGGLVVDLESAVEAAIEKQVRVALDEAGVEAVITRVPNADAGPDAAANQPVP